MPQVTSEALLVPGMGALPQQHSEALLVPGMEAVPEQPSNISHVDVVSRSRLASRDFPLCPSYTVPVYLRQSLITLCPL